MPIRLTRLLARSLTRSLNSLARTNRQINTAAIHKSQGMTIPSLEVNLDGAFEYGQAYVALSRATDLRALSLVGFSPRTIRAHKRVTAFYQSLEEQQRQRQQQQRQPDQQRQFSAASGSSTSSSTTTTSSSSSSSSSSSNAAVAVATTTRRTVCRRRPRPRPPPRSWGLGGRCRTGAPHTQGRGATAGCSARRGPRTPKPTPGWSSAPPPRTPRRPIIPPLPPLAMVVAVAAITVTVGRLRRWRTSTRGAAACAPPPSPLRWYPGEGGRLCGRRGLRSGPCR
jgi:hypothetical protein